MLAMDNAFIRGLERSLQWLPAWAVSLILMGLAAVLAWSVHRQLFAAVTRLVADKDLVWRALVQRTRRPTRFALSTLTVSAAAAVAPLSRGQAEFIRHLLVICLIALIGWVAITALHIWTTVHLRRFKLESEDNLLARKHVTQFRILQRVATILIVMITIAVALMTFEGVRQYGVSLLASAGAAGLVLGLALQPLLKNLIGGIQIAITQPIRIDDAIIVEGEWGNVEEITATYVVVRLWDWRRMVLPLSYFLERPFQNWTREDSSLIGSVMLYTDFTVPVSALRAKLEEIARRSPLWDGRVVSLQVTDLREATMEIRMLASASSAGRAFDLRCEIREKMIAFIQSDLGTSLPRQRAELAGAGLLRPEPARH